MAAGDRGHGRKQEVAEAVLKEALSSMVERLTGRGTNSSEAQE